MLTIFAKKWWWGVEGWKSISCQVAQAVPRIKRTQPKDDPFYLSIFVLPKFFHDLNPLVSFSIKWIGRNSHLLIITFHRWEIEVYFFFFLFLFFFNFLIINSPTSLFLVRKPLFGLKFKNSKHLETSNDNIAGNGRA